MKMKMNLERLKVFYVVAQEGSLANAAKKLHIAQPALSRTIKLLEEELGTQLFDRMSKLGLRLTLQGERTLKFAEKTLREAALFEKLIKEKTEEVQGNFTIVTTPYLASTWLPHHLLGFINQYPKLKIKIVGKLEDINISQGDIIIRTFIAHHPHLIQKHLCFLHTKLWASPDYLKKFGAPQTAEELDNHRLITFDDNVSNPYGSVSWILNVGTSIENVREPYLQNNSYEGLINLANTGLGIIEAYEEYINLKPHHLVQVLPELEGPIVDIYYIFPKATEHSKKIKAFEEYVSSLNFR